MRAAWFTGQVEKDQERTGECLMHTLTRPANQPHDVQMARWMWKLRCNSLQCCSVLNRWFSQGNTFLWLPLFTPPSVQHTFLWANLDGPNSSCLWPLVLSFISLSGANTLIPCNQPQAPPPTLHNALQYLGKMPLLLMKLISTLTILTQPFTY